MDKAIRVPSAKLYFHSARRFYLTQVCVADIGLCMKRYSTVQAAKMLRIDPANLQRLIRQKRVPFPPIEMIGGIRIRLWTENDVERARKTIKRK